MSSTTLAPKKTHTAPPWFHRFPNNCPILFRIFPCSFHHIFPIIFPYNYIYIYSHSFPICSLTLSDHSFPHLFSESAWFLSVLSMARFLWESRIRQDLHRRFPWSCRRRRSRRGRFPGEAGDLQSANVDKPWLVGGFNPFEKYKSQLGWLFPIYRKIKNVPNYQRDKVYRLTMNIVNTQYMFNIYI